MLYLAFKSDVQPLKTANERMDDSQHPDAAAAHWRQHILSITRHPNATFNPTTRRSDRRASLRRTTVTHAP